MGDHGVSAQELAALVAAVPRLPMVTAQGIGAEGDLPAALLAWGRHGRSWMAGVSFLYTPFPIRALVTVWLPSWQVRRRRGETYGTVPRVLLTGAGPGQWPELPAAYPHAPAEWLAAHHHAIRVDQTSPYGLVPPPPRH